MTLYNSASFAGGTLAATGLALQGLWIFLAGFAMFALVLAVGRIVPKKGL